MACKLNYSKEKFKYSAAAHKEQCENEWYFFTRRNRKYVNDTRPNRAAGKGYWKRVGGDKPIFRAGENNEQVRIGGRSTLIYYLRKDSKNKTDMRTEWRMKECRLDGDDLPHDYKTAGTSMEVCLLPSPVYS